MSKKIILEKPAKRRLPKKTAAKVDAFYEMREDRLSYGRKIREAEKVLADLRTQEDAVARELAAELRDMGGATKLSGAVATFSPGSDDVFTVEDWNAFYEYIAKNDAFECLERRPSRAALKDLLQMGKLPDGIKPEKKFTFSLTKASTK